MSVARGVVALLAVTALVSSCSSGSGSDEETVAAGPCDPANSEVTVGVHTEVRGFDVVNGGAVGVAGGTERTAVFDTIMQYDPETREYVPRMAESFEPNDDFTQWTLKLRDGVTFASGNPVTTDAVEFSVDRHGADNTVSQNKAQMDVITSMEIVSPLEMVFTLDAPQGDFPAAFAGAPGMLAEPAVFNAVGAKAFALDPGLGAAGPYKVASYTQGEELVLTRRDDYWGDGEYCVGTIRFNFVDSEQSRRDALLNGDIDVAVLQAASIIDEIEQEGLANEMSYSWGEIAALINHGTGGADRPGKDLRVRQAIAYALDPDMIDQRSTDGTGIPSSALVTEESGLWSEGLEGPPFDPDEARTLLDAAKADGYDGKLTLSCNNAPAKVDWSIAVEAMLESVGFDVTLDTGRDITDFVVGVFYPGDYDVACFPLSMYESSPWASLQAVALGQDPVTQARVGYKSEAMAQAMTELRAASTVEARQDAIAAIQQVWNEEIPSAITGHGRRGTAWNETVTGVRHGLSANILFDDVRVTR